MFTKKYNGNNSNNSNSSNSSNNSNSRTRKLIKNIGKKKRVNKITKKKKTKKWGNRISGGNRANRENRENRENRVNGTNRLIRQYGGSGKLSYCYMEPIKPIEHISNILRKPESCKNTIINNINRYFDIQRYYTNPSQYCYAISSIQLLRNIKEILEYIDKLNLNKKKIDGNVGAIIIPKIELENQELIKKILPEFKKIISPENKISEGNFLKNVIEICFPNSSTSQQDAPEFLRKLNFLDYIPELQFYLGIEYYDNSNKFLKQRTNDNNNQDIEINVFLTLELPKTLNSQNIQEIFDNSQNFEEFTEGNNLKINSKVYINAKKLPFFFVKPNNKYLILQIKLFDYSNNKIFFNIEKISDNLCIRELTESELDIDPNKVFANGKSINYELISISCHLGVANSGHYANFSKQIINNFDHNNPKWVYYNDLYNNNSAINDEKIFMNKTKKMKYNVDNLDSFGNVNYIEIDDINLLNQNYYSPYLLLYKRIQ